MVDKLKFSLKLAFVRNSTTDLMVERELAEG